MIPLLFICLLIILFILLMIHLYDGQSFVVFQQDKAKPSSQPKSNHQKHTTHHNSNYSTTYHRFIVPRMQKIIQDNQTDMRVGQRFYQVMADMAQKTELSWVLCDDDGCITWVDNIAGGQYHCLLYHNLDDNQYWLRLCLMP